MCDAATWLADCCTDTSTCCPQPDWWSRSYNPINAACAASAAAWYQDCGAGPNRTGARSLSPVRTSPPEAASNVRSEDAQADLGPSPPNGVTDTWTSRSFA